MQIRSINAQRAKFPTEEAYREDMKRRAAMRKRKGNFTPKKKKDEKTAP